VAGRFWCDNSDVDLIKEVGPFAYGLLTYLRRLARGTSGHIDPRETTNRAIGEVLGYSAEAISEASKRLETAGRIRVHRTAGKPTIYCILTPEPTGLSGGYLPVSADTPTVNNGTYLPVSAEGPTGLSGGSYTNRNLKELKTQEEGQEDAHALKGRGPTFERVKSYFEAIGRIDEAEEFYDTFQSRGWVTFGSNPVPIADYQAEARKWVRRENRKIVEKQSLPPTGTNSRPNMTGSKATREALAELMAEQEAKAAQRKPP